MCRLKDTGMVKKSLRVRKNQNKNIDEKRGSLFKFIEKKEKELSNGFFNIPDLSSNKRKTPSRHEIPVGTRRQVPSS